MSDCSLETWRIGLLGEILTVQNGYAFKSETFLEKSIGAVPIIRMSNLKSGICDLTDAVYVDQKKVRTPQQFILEEGDFIFGMSGSLSNYATVRKQNLPCYLNQRVGKLCPKESHKSFLNYLFLSETVQRQILATAAGGAQLNISARQIEDIEVLIPSLKEQKKIAEILTSVDEVIENTQSQISKLEDLKKATMNELLTKGIGHTEFKETEIGRIPRNWRTLELEKLTTGRYGIVDGPFGSNLKTEHYRPHGIPVIQSGFVTSFEFRPSSYVYVDQEKFEEQKRSAVYPNDIVMAKIGANAGTSAIVPSNHQIGILAGNSLKITVDTTVSITRFVHYYLILAYQTGYIQNLLTVTAQPAISLSSLRKLILPVPPVEEQKAIVDVMVKLSQVMENQKSRLSTQIDLKRSLMQDLLTGKVRVTVN